MTPRCLCLIPTTGRATLHAAVASAHADGWVPIVYRDTGHEGPVAARNALLERLDEDDGALVRYLDDDDTLMPHHDSILHEFDADPGLGVIYTDNLITSIRHPGSYLENRLWGDPVRDLLRVNPWVWVARLGALRALRQMNGFVWDPNDLCMEGLTCWLRFIESGILIEHVPVLAYRYNKDLFGTCVSRSFPEAYRDSVIQKCREFQASRRS